LPPNTDPDLLVGTNTADDAGVYRIAPDLALVQTLDFFTPILDDPYDFGRVAAANALSDVYAMGGRPLTALNILCYPAGVMEPETAAAILRGGADKVREAGAASVGGHTVQDREPKYGLSVTGVVHPDRIVRNVGARPGDRLVLTKPLGTGVITTGLKRDETPPEVLAVVAEGMATLNRAASQAMLEVGVHAATDITGFGFVGHLMEMLEGSGVSARVHAREVPFYEGFWPLAERGLFPGGAHDNLAFVRDRLTAPDGIAETWLLALCDPQTSGGLLIAVPEERHSRLVDALMSRGCIAATVGEVVDTDGGVSSIRVVF
jgi:selenide,water dikinase